MQVADKETKKVSHFTKSRVEVSSFGSKYSKMKSYKGGEVETLASKRMAKPDIVVEVIHIQH